MTKKILLLLPLVLFSYLLLNTGLFSDDFVVVDRLKDKNFTDTIIPQGNFYFIETPLMYYTHYVWYHFFGIDRQAALNVFKIIYIFLSFFMISRFFGIYVSRQKAFLISFLFLFFPSHDSTVYCFMLQYLTLSFAFYLYAFYLAHRDRLLQAFLCALAGSFISYGSPAIAAALFLLFVLNKEVKKGLVLLVPNIIYSAYYVFISKIASAGVDKVGMGGGINIFSLTKHFILQILTFIDATIGPSMWLKIYYSFSQLSIISIVIGIVLVAIFHKKYKENKETYNPKLVLSLSVLTLLSFGMFAVTGHYPQIAFNLGNRVTIFGSLVLAYLFVLMPLTRKFKTLVFAVVMFTTLGISDHWKDWNIKQQEVAENIRNNKALRDYRGKEAVYVSGNQYSKYGPLSHIEFLSENWVPGALFGLMLSKNINTASLNKRHQYKNGYLIDKKYNRREKVNTYINIYDSQGDKLFRLPAGKLNDYIDSLPANNRHWVQILRFKPVKDVILALMPRLKYALDM